MSEQVVWAVKNGDVESLKKKQFDANAKVGKQTLLVAAADYGQSEVISYLVSLGADVNQGDEYGITPLLAAIYEDHVEAAKILLQKGASKAGKCPDGSSYSEQAQSTAMKKLLA